MAQKKLGTFHLQILLWFTYCLCYCIRKPLSIYKFYIESELHLSKYQLGLIDLALLLPYAGLQILGANWWDRMKVENLIPFCLTSAALSLMLLSLTSHFGIFCLLVAVSGAAQAPLWPACIKVLNNSIASDKSLASAIGVLGSAPFAGATLSSYFVSFISDRLGWRHSTIWIFLACFLLSFICKIVLAKNRREIKTGQKEEDYLHDDYSLVQLLKIPGVMKVLLSVTFLKFTRYVLYMWLPLLLSQWYGFSMLQAGLISSWFYVGAALGGPGLGYLLSYHKSSITLVIAIGGASCFLLLALGNLIYSVKSLAAGVFLFIIGFCNCGPDSIICGVITFQLGNANGRDCGVKVTSIVNGIASIGGIIEGPLVSYLLHFDSCGWELVILVISLASTLSAMSFRSAQPTIDQVGSRHKEKHSSVV